ncbi:DUF167 domain-containing protein [Candidatus Woesearchaeota archaeon]|nr:DUF167 domain-containing protein [Candidatus Woesearchaeota archaeon]
MISGYIQNNRLRVIVKPNSKETLVIGFDKEKDALRIAVKAPADKNKANKELLRFLSKESGMRAGIRSGLSSKEKSVEFF